MRRISKFRWIGASRILLLGATLMGASSALFATNSGCGGGALNSYGATQGNNVGCWTADQSFSNFAVVATAGQTPSNNALATSNTFTTVTTPWVDDAVFSPLTGNNWRVTGSGAAANTFASGLSYLTNTQQSHINEGAAYHNPTPGQSVNFTSIGLSAAGSTGNGSGAGDSMSVTMTFCVGVMACGPADEVTLKATWGNNATGATYSCAIAGPTSTADFSCGTPTSGGVTVSIKTGIYIPTLTVENIYTMAADRTSPGVSSTDTLTSITNTFGNQEFMPEPSTFVMLGSALIGLGGLHYRRRKASQKKDA